MRERYPPTPPAFARDAVAGEGCRAVARSAKAGITTPPAGYGPASPFHCGENEIQASLISSASVGATPTPATNFGRCSGCRSVKPVSQTTVGSDDWSITSTSHQPSPATQWQAKAAAP